MIRWCVPLLLALGLVPGHALAQNAISPPFKLTDETTGAELYAECEVNVAMCNLTMGAIATGDWLREAMHKEGIYCPPPPPAIISGTQARLLIMQYMRQHPELLHYPAV